MSWDTEVYFKAKCPLFISTEEQKGLSVCISTTKVVSLCSVVRDIYECGSNCFVFFVFLFLLTFTPGSKASVMIIRDCIYFFHLKFFLLSSVSPYESMGNLCGIEKRGD